MTYRCPTKRGGRITTVTVRVTPYDVEKIDACARKNGLSRAHFVLKCTNAGYRALKEAGELT